MGENRAHSIVICLLETLPPPLCQVFWFRSAQEIVSWERREGDGDLDSCFICSIDVHRIFGILVHLDLTRPSHYISCYLVSRSVKTTIKIWNVEPPTLKHSNLTFEAVHTKQDSFKIWLSLHLNIQVQPLHYTVVMSVEKKACSKMR